MKLNRVKLINDLNKVMPGISTGTVVLEGADTIVFSKGHIYSYNSAISVDVKMSEEIELQGVVKGEDFYNCLTKLPNDEIELEVVDNTWHLKDGKINVKITLLSVNNIFERFESLAPNNTWIDIDGVEFNKALKVCNMPKNSSRYAGVYVNGTEFLSTDGYVMNKYTVKENYPLFWINNNAVSELLKWDSFTAVEMNKTWLQFKSVEGTIFSVKTLDTSAFPSERVSKVLEDVANTPATFESEFTDDFYKAIDRAAAFSGESDDHEVVSFNIGKEGSVVKSERTSGAYEEVIEEIKSDTEFEMLLDIQMIRDSAPLFTKFKLLQRAESINILLIQDSAYKLLSTIM